MTFEEFQKAMYKYDLEKEHLRECSSIIESQECCITKEYILKFIYELFNEH